MEVAELCSLSIEPATANATLPVPMERLPSPPGDIGQDAAISTSRFQCQECSQTFGRIEHLTRHSRSHMKERYLKCAVCRKGFYRIDALKRHEQIHKEPRRSALVKGGRACNSCAFARRKCSGDTPCSACQKRRLECRYPDSGRGRAATDQLSFLETTGVEPSDAATTGASATEMPMPMDDGDSPMSWSQSQSQAPESPTMNTGGCEQTSIPSQNQPTTRILSSPALAPPTYENAYEQQVSRLPGPVSWFDSNFSSINWLPEDWTPEFQSGNTLGSFDPDQALMFGNHARSNSAGYGSVHNATTTTGSVILSNRRHKDNTPRLPITAHVVDGHDLSSPGSQSTHSGGRYYVDGDGARLPRVRKAPYGNSDTYVHAFFDNQRNFDPAFAFPEVDDYQDNFDDNLQTIPANVYSEIFRMFNATCISSDHYPNFQGGSFPSLRTLSQFVRNYTKYFRSVLPFTHPSSFELSASHWLLVMAMATVGSHYGGNETGDLVVLALHEFLRRLILVVIEHHGTAKPDILTLTQVKILSCIGMMYSGDERLKTMARRDHHDLVLFCHEDWEKLSTFPRLTHDAPEQINVDWTVWCQAETSRRIGYCIWLLDVMWKFHFNMRPLMSLDDARIPIPCQEVLWEAESALDWQQLYTCATPSPSLHEVIQLAYIEKRVQSSTGEFSRILCVHALFRRTWEVEEYFKQPLTSWTPTAEKQSISTIERSTPVWLQGIPTYAKWRNSACDCLDILHWHANSVIGAASGMEHPTVLHLHLARVILLTPFRQILRLAELVASGSPPSDTVEATNLREHIKRWVFDDQHKARLAMIHAGVLFWHVRRYSADAFYEPSSVLLATLALWAYGSFAAPTSAPIAQVQLQHREGESPRTTATATTNDDDEDAESLFPTSMQLDRPADDELVQLFVKRGTSMKANITGVGNLCSKKGPVRVLIEGRNLLVGLKVWGYSREGIRLLTSLIEVLRSDGS